MTPNSHKAKAGLKAREHPAQRAEDSQPTPGEICKLMVLWKYRAF